MSASWVWVQNSAHFCAQNLWIHMKFMYIIKYNWCFLCFYPKFFWIFFLLYINCWFLQSLTESDNFLCGKMTMKTFKLSVKLTVTHSLLSASERAWLPKNWVPAWAARKITTKYDSAWKIILILVENLNVVIKIYFDSFHTIFFVFWNYQNDQNDMIKFESIGS